jgi:hypothetical protein
VVAATLHLVPWLAHPNVSLFIVRHDHRHGLRMDRFERERDDILFLVSGLGSAKLSNGTSSDLWPELAAPVG